MNSEQETPSGGQAVVRNVKQGNMGLLPELVGLYNLWVRARYANLSLYFLDVDDGFVGTHYPGLGQVDVIFFIFDISAHPISNVELCDPKRVGRAGSACVCRNLSRKRARARTHQYAIVTNHRTARTISPYQNLLLLLAKVPRSNGLDDSPTGHQKPHDNTPKRVFPGRKQTTEPVVFVEVPED
jgi:hypothetical protein